MYQTTLPPEQALGHILRHNLADAYGRKAFSKGHRIAAPDLPRLRALGVELVRVAVLEPGDDQDHSVCRAGSVAQSGRNDWAIRRPDRGVASITSAASGRGAGG